MKNVTLAQSYLKKARLRLAILPVLLEAGGYSDVVREAQEIVELALKGMLRQVGIEPPKWPDVGPFLLEHLDRFPPEVAQEVPALAAISKWLRREREFAFYGPWQMPNTLWRWLPASFRSRGNLCAILSADCSL